MSMLGEVTHLQTIADDLTNLTMDPHKLPTASEQVSEPATHVIYNDFLFINYINLHFIEFGLIFGSRLREFCQAILCCKHYM